MISTKDQLYLLNLMIKHGVKVLHYETGKVHVEIGTWHQYEDLFLQILQQLQDDKLITFFRINQNEIYIEFPKRLLSNQAQITKLLSYIDQYHL